eukprot:1826577-Rhodomonas_salina.3
MEDFALIPAVRGAGARNAEAGAHMYATPTVAMRAVRSIFTRERGERKRVGTRAREAGTRGGGENPILGVDGHTRL